MQARSAKNKGSRFEIYLVEKFRETLDVNTHRQPGSGAGLEKNDIRLPSLNIEIEAKNSATFHIQSDWEQTKSQRTTGNMAVLAIRHPKKPEFQETVILMDLNDFIVLVQGQQNKIEVSYTANKEDKWKIQKLVDYCKQVIKLYE